ncbi:hypothetical protein RAA17_14175 [Komagataeibacter rhaeticus]|nr:hypothetical protein [Komagataeibacter rhaeticus]
MLPSPSVTERARVAALLRADRRARLLARDIAAGLKPDMGATGPAATARVVETTRMELAPTPGPGRCAACWIPACWTACSTAPTPP